MPLVAFKYQQCSVPIYTRYVACIQVHLTVLLGALLMYLLHLYQNFITLIKTQIKR